TPPYPVATVPKKAFYLLELAGKAAAAPGAEIGGKMKKTGLLLVLSLALLAHGQEAGSPANSAVPPGVEATNANFPKERVQAPTFADLYCAGFISKETVPNANFVAGGLQTPNTTKFVNGDIVYLAGGGYQS